jgi:[ribosomal protein S5]-alanine N-acetyltransferase
MKEILETERLFIKAMNKSDAEFVKALLNTEGWIRNIGNRNISTINDAEDYIQRISSNTNYSYNVVRLKENAIAIGIVTFIKRDNYKYPDIGFAFLPEYSGKGYAYEASKRFLDNILLETEWKNIIAITLTSNHNSIKLLEKLGLKQSKTFNENEAVLFLYSLHEIDG